MRSTASLVSVRRPPTSIRCWRRLKPAADAGLRRFQQEILYRYAGLRRIDLAEQVYDLFAQLCPVIFSVTLADTDRAKGLLGSSKGIGVRDAIHAAVMTNNEVASIATFDTAFDHVAGVSRLPLE